jgi:hypothetical protein
MPVQRSQTRRPGDSVVNVSLFAKLRAFVLLAAVYGVAMAGLLILAPARLEAQVGNATLNGTVTDTTGAAIPGATINITNKDTGGSRVVVSGAAGEYSSPALPPGHYIVTVAKAGFSTTQETGVTLDVDQIASLNFSLKVGGSNETVEVSSSTSFLETTDASLGTVIPKQQVTDLPLNGRQFSQLLQLAPGTVPIDNSQNAGKAPNFGSGAASPGVDGQTNRSNLFFLDGIIASNPFFGGFSFSPSVDAIQEFKAQSHTDQAEFGQATGAVVSVISRSGTNEFHGVVYEFVRNTALNAQNAFATTNLPYHLNQFGGSFGGPILKDKLFFYANYEGGRQVISPSANVSTVPTDAERAGDFSGLLPGNLSATIYDPATFNPVTLAETPFPGNTIPSGRINAGMLALLNGIYPKANQPANSSGENNYLAPTKNATTGDQGTIRVDYLVGAKDTINGRFSINRSTLASPSSLANLFETGFSGENTGATWVHTFNPTLVAEITGGYNRLNIPQGIYTPVNQTELYNSSGVGPAFNPNPGDTPFVQVPGYSLQGGSYTGFWNGGGPIGPMNIVQVGGNVDKTKGPHSLKFGAAYYHTWMYTNWNGNNMDFSYKGTWNAACQYAAAGSAIGQAECPAYNPTTGNLTAAAGGDAVAAMLLSSPIDATRNLGNSGVNLIESTPAIYAQDSWRVNDRLTVNYGLRWDYSAPMTERNNRLATYNYYNQTYDVVHGDVDLPSGPLPANTIELGRNSIVTSHYGDFSPRFGLAFRAYPKTMVRMGIGRSFDDWGLPLQVGQQNRGAWPSGLAQNASQQPLNTSGLSLKPDGTSVTGQNPFYGAAVIPPSPLPAGGLGFQDIKWVPASSLQWNLEVEQELGALGTLSMAYVGSHTEHSTILSPYNTAQASAIPLAERVNPYPDLIFGGVGTSLRSTGWTNYNSFQAKWIRTLSHGLAYNLAFTWAQNLAFSSCNGDFSNVCIQNLYNFSGDYGPSDLNVPLIFTASATYELPFGRGKQWANSGGISNAIFGNWQLNTILAIRSGLQVNPTNGNNSDTANAGGGTQRINFTGNPESSAPHKRTEWWNPTVFQLPAPGTYGNASINSLRGPNYWDDDLSLFKRVPFGERVNLELRFEFYDVFNHPNLGNPAGFAGTSTNAAGVTTYNSGFNTITSTVPTTGPGSGRELQLGAKLIF